LNVTSQKKSFIINEYSKVSHIKWE